MLGGESRFHNKVGRARWYVHMQISVGTRGFDVYAPKTSRLSHVKVSMVIRDQYYKTDFAVTQLR